jgi:hypothetical protein
MAVEIGVGAFAEGLEVLLLRPGGNIELVGGIEMPHPEEG